MVVQRPTREIAGQNTLFTRTMHDMAYDPVRDEIVVPQFYAYAILTFRGDADGDVAPIRKIFGPSTQLKNPQALAIDPIHGEIFVPQGEKNPGLPEGCRRGRGSHSNFRGCKFGTPCRPGDRRPGSQSTDRLGRRAAHL